MPKKEQYAKNPDKFREWTRNYYWAHREERMAYAREYYRRNFKGNKERQRQHGMNHGYRMSTDTYDILLAKQGGTCAVCKRLPNADGKRLHVDHCHKTGIVRGILCNNCNSSIGNAKESPERLRELAAYLEQEPPDVPRLPPPRVKRKLPRP